MKFTDLMLFSALRRRYQYSGHPREATSYPVYDDRGMQGGGGGFHDHRGGTDMRGGFEPRFDRGGYRHGGGPPGRRYDGGPPGFGRGR